MRRKEGKAISLSLKNKTLFALIALLSSILFLKNLIWAVRIEDGTGYLWVDYLGFASFLFSIFLISRSLPFILSIFFLLNLFDTVMLFANRLYFSYYGDYITVDFFSLASHIPFTKENILALIKLKDILIFFDIPFLFILLVISWKLKYSLKRRVITGILILFLGFFFTGLNLHLLHSKLPNVLTFRYGSSMLFNSMCTHNFYILSFYEDLLKKEKVSFPLPEISDLLDNNNLDPLPDFKIKQKLWNIIIIDIESLGAEIINKRIDGKEITPTLNKFAREGIYFPNFYSQALTCSGTLDVELSSLTTLYPSSKSPYAIKYAKNIPFALPRFLNQHGYKTMFFHANSEDFYRRGIVLRIFGFKELYFSEYFKSPERKYRGTDDYPFFLECAEVLKKSEQPFFAFILTLSSHTPFDLPKGEKPQLEIANSNLDETTKRYFQIMNYVDKSVKAFVESIGVKSLLENSILIIFGDHPRHYPEEGKGEMEIVRDAINKKVPLIIFNPSFEGKAVNKLGSHVDITPTILSVLGLKYDGVLLGRNLLSKGEGFVIINRNPVVIIKGKNYFWGYLENGLSKSPSRNERTEIEEANKLMEILRYSEYTFKK